MEKVYNLPYLTLLFYTCLIIIPIIIFYYLKLRLTKKFLISVGRMIVQLLLVGLYLKFIFSLNNILINIGWVLLMLFVANISILYQSGLSFKKFYLRTFPAYFLSALFIFFSLLLIFDFNTLISARYLIPLEGMVLGNILRSNIIGLERFYSELLKGEKEYIQYLLLGAKTSEALKPFLREAYKAAITPQIGGMATIGLVSLPGMMTGQILGGSSPIVAIKYQIMIMIAIFLSVSISVFLSINFSKKSAFDNFNRLDKEIYRK